MTNNQIELIATRVLQKYVARGGAFKQFENIIKSEQIKYKEVNSQNKNFVGAFTKGNNNQLYIMVNQKVFNEGRKNFTIAHELGHYFLNHQLKTNTFYCFDNEILENDFHQDEIENEANYFATCLLMPEEKLTNAFKSILNNSSRGRIKDYLSVTKSTYGIWCGIKDQLTKRYGVSEEALRYRLKMLGLADFYK